MLKKRLIFVLYFDSGYFHLSRNFRLQKVGDVRWLVDKFRFKTIGNFIDEIAILDVSRESTNSNIQRCGGEKFEDAVKYIMRETFLPLTLGGGIRTLEDAQRCFELGADKILLNTPITQNPSFVKECVSRYGSQAVIGAIDAMQDQGKYRAKISNAQVSDRLLEEQIEQAVSLGIGELLLNSIERDGTGMGFDFGLLDYCSTLNIPLILCGGAGKPDHFADAISQKHVEAVATGNLFNFIGKGFELVRNHLLNNNFAVRQSKIS